MADYVLFKNKDGTHDNGGLGGLGGLGGWADNTAFKRFETYMTSEAQQKREINRNSGEVNGNTNTYTNIYTTENIIQNVEPKSENFVPGEVVYKTIVIPFYICLMDIVIFNDLFIEVVDNGSIETKNKILISGKIRKYRLNGVNNNYDIFIEMENEDVFHVKKRGIMMRVRVPEQLRQLILNTMVNYVADGKDLDPKSKAGVSGGGGSDAAAAANDTWKNLSRSGSGGGGNRGRGGGGGGGGGGGPFACFGCFKP